METQNPLLKDEDGEEVDVHLYRSMIGSLMYFTSSRPDIMFAVCACTRYQVNPKVSHLYDVKRIFSDYARTSLDRKSITGGCQFLRCRLISWQCKKQTVVANSTTEAKYVAASSCCDQMKTINGEVQLQALVDGKKIIITEATIRRDLQLEDAEGITLVDETQGRHDYDLMFDTGVLNDEEVFARQDMAEQAVKYCLTAATITNIELTLAQTLAELKSARPKTKGVVIRAK
ncbi:hypothetical protein Tco_0704414 [Tanacetum coccineum]|uniref:Uncharacterized protein n=1 Tax=Tanacetum coccineum TaxID=301880 RepID=A0ABQ4Y398_9ASTR